MRGFLRGLIAFTVSWEVLGWVVAALWGFGGAMLGAGEFGAAKLGFVLGNVLLLIRIAAWAWGSRPNGRFLLHGAVLMLAGIGIAAVSIKGVAWIDRKALPSRFRIVRFERHPFEAGKPFLLNVYYRYDGDEPISIRGYSYFEFHHFELDETQPDKLRGLETTMWERMLLSLSEPSHGFMMDPGANGWVTLAGPILTMAQVEDLQPRQAGAMFFMGYFRYGDEHAEYTAEFCAFAQSNPEVFVSCEEHQGPPTPRAPTVTMDK